MILPMLPPTRNAEARRHADRCARGRRALPRAALRRADFGTSDM